MQPERHRQHTDGVLQADLMSYRNTRQYFEIMEEKKMHKMRVGKTA
ncbi:hypothetical protein DA2_2328 [Desulfovibrio sp. A2]|nr:hypothetical protein DA2_2328 [Desulfovibrio sp. A2]